MGKKLNEGQILLTDTDGDGTLDGEDDAPLNPNEEVVQMVTV